MQWFKNLSTMWKIILIAIALVVAIFIFDRITGGVSDLKGWMFDRESAARMAKVEELTQENAVLRAQKDEAEKQAIASKAKEAVFEDKLKTIDANTKAELDKTNKALEQQAKEEAETAQPIDNHTRCERTKQKMIVLGVKSAQEMNCDDVK